MFGKPRAPARSFRLARYADGAFGRMPKSTGRLYVRVDSQNRKSSRREANHCPFLGQDFGTAPTATPTVRRYHPGPILGRAFETLDALISGRGGLVPKLTLFETPDGQHREAYIGFCRLRKGALMPFV